MEGSLYDLLRKCRDLDAKDECSHVTTYGPASKWSIADDKYEEFWNRYCEIAEDPECDKLCLAEVPRKHMPIIADLTLKFHPLDNDTDEPYEMDFILAIVYCYQQVIKKTMKISESETELICCVMEADKTVEDNLIICRIRLQFPYCKTLGQVQNRVIRPIVLQMVRSINVCARLPSQPVNDWEDIIDPLSVEKPIMMYGSSQGPNIPKLVLQYIFSAVQKDDIEECKTAVMEISDTFFFQNHEHMTNGIVSSKLFEDEEQNDYWLPYFLSIYYLKEITLTQNVSASAITVNNKSSRKNNNSGVYEDENQDGPEYMSSIFLGMMDRKRSEEKHYWQDIGKALFNTFHGGKRGLEKWIDFSESGEVFDSNECSSLYYNFVDNRMTIKTLAFYAREDSPNEYKKWHDNWCLNSLEKSTSMCHTDVAEAIYRVYWLEFACANLKQKTIYEFRNHVWKNLDSGHSLRAIISGKFVEILENFRTDISLQVMESRDKNYKDTAEIMIQKICKLITKLKNFSFKNAIMAETSEKFYIEEFEQKLDTNPNLMGCVNGVIETLDTKAVFRDGKPEDFVSRSTSVFYRHDMNEKHTLYLRLMDWLRKTFPDKTLLNHFGKLMGASLRGRNADKIFPIHTGCGNNSKSMIKKLIEAAFGEYVVTFKTTTFTGARSSGPDPSVARSKFAHLAFIQEPDAETPLKTGVLKEMTGGDRFFARFLNENGGEIEPMFTLHMQCNNIPMIPQCDKAIKNRVRVLPYLAEFVKDPPKTPDEQFKQRKFLMDPFFEAKIPEMASAFLFYCINMYKVYRREGLKDPALVVEHTDKYWEDNDLYSQFIKENLEKAYKTSSPSARGNAPLDDTAYISLADLYTRFKDFHREFYGNMKTPDRQVFRNEMEVRLTKSLNRKYYGVRFKQPSNSELEN